MAITQGQMPNQEVVQLIAQLQQIVQLRNTLQQQTQQALPAVGLAAMPPASGFGLGPPALAGVASMNSYGSHVPLGVQAQPGNMPPAPVQAPPSIPPISIPNSLFQSLSAAVGAMNAASAAPQASASVPAPVITRQQSSEPYQTPSFSNLESLRRKNTTAIASLYTDFKHQCPQCALRFSERQKLDEHLDWHFQQKRKEKQKAKKAVSRQWLLSAADWIEYKGGLTEPDCM
jgi:pre-mRNA cleavage complex 2 protein Pcf11